MLPGDRIERLAVGGAAVAARTREAELREVPLWKANTAAWPPSVRRIGQDELDCLDWIGVAVVLLIFAFGLVGFWRGLSLTSTRRVRCVARRGHMVADDERQFPAVSA